LIYDVAVIGAGPGGYVAAIKAAQLGLKTVCIDKRKTLGGTCLNVGCIPSKVLLHDTEESNDFAKMMLRKQKVIDGFTVGIDYLFKQNKVDRLVGKGCLIDPNTIDVEGTKVQAKHIILATGSEPISLPFLPFDEKNILSSTGALSLEKVPKKMLIIGAGIIGVEMGSVYQRLGSEVHLIEYGSLICPALDLSLSKGLQKLLTEQGLHFHMNSKVIAADGLTLSIETPGGLVKMDAEKILVAIGRRPMTQGLGLENVGIQVDAKGFVPIDSSFRTSKSNIFAIGDIVDGPMLAHKASEEGTVVAELIAGLRSTIDYLAIPNVAYTYPEAAAVGLTEEEVKKRNISYKVSTFPMKANSRARCMDDDEGFVKILADEKTHRILGIHILSRSASELIGEATLAIHMKAKAEDLATMCHAHPTLSEAIKEAAIGLFHSPIHIFSGKPTTAS
jgi:dihydrolipoamide dehydrogenase